MVVEADTSKVKDYEYAVYLPDAIEVSAGTDLHVAVRIEPYSGQGETAFYYGYHLNMEEWRNLDANEHKDLFEISTSNICGYYSDEWEGQIPAIFYYLA